MKLPESPFLRRCVTVDDVRAVAHRPFALQDVSAAYTGTSLVGQPVSAPLALGPTGYTKG
jgi:isopentenyl diphosphate isomerase/L-lactate dehydrogenase-like FMN-dependent dehydrogenase